jgi:hypothetical protein
VNVNLEHETRRVASALNSTHSQRLLLRTNSPPGGKKREERVNEGRASAYINTYLFSSSSFQWVTDIPEERHQIMIGVVAGLATISCGKDGGKASKITDKANLPAD